MNKHLRIVLTIFTIALSPALWAGNVTISDAFDGNEAEMPASPAACENRLLAYRNAGELTVSQSGNYEVADAGNFLGFTDAASVADIVVLIYNAAFDPANPGTNLHAVVDEGSVVNLQSGTTYTVVVQHWCENKTGPYGVVIRGGGDITASMGFDSSAYTFGAFSGNSAEFPLGLGTHNYAASQAMGFARTGMYYFGDVGDFFGSSAALLVYENSFDPADTSANLVGDAIFTGSVFLQSGKTYVLVTVDVFDQGGEWQFALFSPGQAGFNTGLSGTWYQPSRSGQGAFLDVSSQLGFLFGALFTFDTASAGAQSSTEAVGSPDQRWFTFFGPTPDEGQIADVKYESTTGGVFGQEVPAPVTDSNYGSGSLQVVACDHLILKTTLPDTETVTWDLERSLPDGVELCAGLVDAAPIEP